MGWSQDDMDFYGEWDHPAARWLGTSLEVTITKSAEETAPTAEALTLLDTIGSHLEAVLAQAEAALVARYGSVEAVVGKIAEPQVWIDASGGCHDLTREEWTLLVPRKTGGPDAVWHLEFSGGVLRECWDGAEA